jgi:2-polyprenyl-3-methyl-5-hydroxy-6-metoxy-1,4-benzoquinol methylase
MTVWRTPAVATVAVLSMLSASVAAQLASRPAAEWVKTLETSERLAGLRIDEIVTAMKLRPGDVVADLGAGSGPFVVPFARAVTPTGKVYAVDIDKGFFPLIQSKTKEAGVANVQTVLGEFTDPKLPLADVDVAFFHDVLHHIENRQAYLESLMKYLKPTARIVVVEYNPAQSPHSDQPELQVSKDQASAWLAPAGFKPAEDVALFPDKWFVIYRRLR